MPSQDTWSAVAGVKSPAAKGRVRTWVTTPNFGALPKDQKPVQPYSDNNRNVAMSRTLQQYWTTTGGPVTTAFNDYELTPQQLITAYDPSIDAVKGGAVAEIRNAVLLKSYLKIADTKVNIAVALAEASKTSSLIYDTARRIDKAYRAFRRGNLKGIAENLNITPKRLHKSWLEYKYGWMPLLMDVKGAAEFFAQQHVVRPTRFTVRATEEVVKTSSVIELERAYGGKLPPDWPTSKFISVRVKAKATFHCELSSPHVTELQQLGLTNPALVAWELVPFSFVFDWFVQVGDYLTGLTALQGVTIRHQCLSQEEDRSVSHQSPPTLRVNEVGDGRTYAMSARSWVFSEKRYSRSNNFASPLGLYPPVKNGFDFKKLITSLALIRGSYRGNARV